jgi:hypothetical protein
MLNNKSRFFSLLPMLAVGIAAAFFAWYPISDGDIFWHLAAGREILTTGSIPHIDPFSYTSQATWQWTDLHWFYQVCMYVVQKVAGFGGLVAANSLFFGGAVGLLFFASAGRKGAWLSALLWIVALYEVRYLVSHRPIVFSLLFFALFLFCLEQYAGSGKRRYLAALLPIQIAWVNSQPLFVIGLVMYAVYFIGAWMDVRFQKRSYNAYGRDRLIGMRERQFIVVIGIALFIAGLVNPYGFHAYSLATMLFGRIGPTHANIYAVHIPENIPLLWMIGTNQSRFLYATMAVTVIALVLIAIRPRSVRLSYLLIAGCMLFLAFRAQRNIVLYFIAVLPLIGMQLPEVYEAITPGLRRVLFTVAASALALLVGTGIRDHALMLRCTRAAGSVAPFSFPAGSVAYFRQHAVAGNLFNADRHGGYLLWNLYPPRRVFVDTRYAIRPPAFFAEYLAILDDPALFSAVCRKFDITAVVLPLALTDRYLALARALFHDPEWRLVLCDGAEALFVRDSIAPTAPLLLSSSHVADSLAQTIQTLWHDAPALQNEALGYLGNFFLQVGLGDNAARVEARRVVAEADGNGE